MKSKTEKFCEKYIFDSLTKLIIFEKYFNCNIIEMEYDLIPIEKIETKIWPSRKAV